MRRHRLVCLPRLVVGAALVLVAAAALRAAPPEPGSMPSLAPPT